MFEDITMQIQHIKRSDPAARNTFEIILLYPSIHAVLLHRLSNLLYRFKLIFISRLISQLGRFLTGIEIHPKANIGKGLFIDHGMGVVIGETSIIKNNVKIYHGVTLGAVKNTEDKRHPTIMDDVIIGANATVLGNITIGENSTIGAGAVVVKDVPPNSVATGIPAKVVNKTTL
ncbi:MAG: serine O-acetyltransferase EpsC [Anaerorhabdus sp.]